MDKKQLLQQTFDMVSQGYDHPSLAFFPETAKRMVVHLKLQNSMQLLDVCTGTGVVALQAAGQLSKGEVTGIDLSAGMLSQAKHKAELQNLNNTRFVQMDLDNLSFPDKYFDVATCSFGLFFLDDMQQGLKNIASKVKPQGKIAISTFNEGAFEPMSSLFIKQYEAFGYEAPPLSWKQITTDQQISDIFADAAIQLIEIHREPLGMYLSSAQDWWDIVWNAGYRGLLNQMSDEELAYFKEQHIREVQKLCDDSRVWLNTGVAIAIGEK